MDTIKRIARSKAFWLALSALATAYGLLPKPIADLLPVVGPEIVEAANEGAQ